MTRIDFHSNAGNPLDYLYRLIRKAYLSGHKIVLVCDDEARSAQLDEALWSHQSADFLPHGRIGHPEADDAPILIASPADETAHHDVMINLTRGTPQFFSRFERLIEIVGGEADDVAAGRERWSFYRDRGYALSHHDAAARAA